MVAFPPDIREFGFMIAFWVDGLRVQPRGSVPRTRDAGLLGRASQGCVWSRRGQVRRRHLWTKIAPIFEGGGMKMAWNNASYSLTGLIVKQSLYFLEVQKRQQQRETRTWHPSTDCGAASIKSVRAICPTSLSHRSCGVFQLFLKSSSQFPHKTVNFIS